MLKSRSNRVIPSRKQSPSMTLRDFKPNSLPWILKWLSISYWHKMNFANLLFLWWWLKSNGCSLWTSFQNGLWTTRDTSPKKLKKWMITNSSISILTTSSQISSALFFWKLLNNRRVRICPKSFNYSHKKRIFSKDTPKEYWLSKWSSHSSHKTLLFTC